MDEVDAAILRSYAGTPAPRRLHILLRLLQAGYGALAARLPESGLVVDLGGGEGLLAQRIVRTRPGVRAIVVDSDPVRVRRLAAAAAGLPVEPVLSAMEHFAVPECRAVLLVDVLHYLDEVAQDTLLARAAVALRPGGVLLLRDPDASAGWRFSVNLLHERLFLAAGWTRARRGRYRTGAAWVARLASLGLEAWLGELSPRSPYADRLVVGRKR